VEWVLIFVIQTSLGMASLSGTGCDLFRTYRACADLANEFNDAPDFVDYQPLNRRTTITIISIVPSPPP
jgi:hypothetical protein